MTVKFVTTKLSKKLVTATAQPQLLLTNSLQRNFSGCCEISLYEGCEFRCCEMKAKVQS